MPAVPLPKPNTFLYFGFRISSLTGGDGYRTVPRFDVPGGRTSDSPLRWTYASGAPPVSYRYELFADIYFISMKEEKPAGSSTVKEVYYYGLKYWYVRVEPRIRQGILPVAGATKVQIPDSSFVFVGNTGDRYYTGGSSAYSQPPKFFVPGTSDLIYLPRVIRGASPYALFGYSKAKPIMGPGTTYTQGTPGAADPDTGPNDPGNADTSTTTTGDNKPADDHNSVKLKNYTLTMNPPPIRFATGAFVPMDVSPESTAVSDIDSKEGGFRQAVLGRGTVSDRISRKGWIAQYVEWSGDWNTEAPSSDVSSKNPDAANWTKDSLMLDQGIRYGFRFHYNPGEIAFGMGEYQNINPAVIMSSKTSVMPITNPENPPSVTLNLLLNRTEDVGLISRKRIKGGKYSYFVNSGDTEGLNPYSAKYMTEEHLRGIATKGTMWDLEFLFRTGLGRPMPTTWRGKTADLGIFFGVPIILHLSDQMTYLGRMSSISYTHTSFTMNMVPILTSVSINVVRLPDGVATSFGKTKKPKSGKK